MSLLYQAKFICFLKAKQLTEAVKVKNKPQYLKEFKIPKKLKKPETTSIVTSALESENVTNTTTSTSTVTKQTTPTAPKPTMSTASKPTKSAASKSTTSTAAKPTTSTSASESSIDFDVETTSRVIKRKAEGSEDVKPKAKQTKLYSYFTKK